MLPLPSICPNQVKRHHSGRLPEWEHAHIFSADTELGSAGNRQLGSQSSLLPACSSSRGHMLMAAPAGPPACRTCVAMYLGLLSVCKVSVSWPSPKSSSSERRKSLEWRVGVSSYCFTSLKLTKTKPLSSHTHGSHSYCCLSSSDYCSSAHFSIIKIFSLKHTPIVPYSN